MQNLLYNLKNMIRETSYFKNQNNPCYIDLIITDRSKSFQNYMVTETGLSDSHKMCITVMKMYYKKLLLFIIISLRISIMILL